MVQEGPMMVEPELRYIPLRNHTMYSLLEGTIRIPELLERAEDLGLEAVGIADTGHLFGAADFCFSCQKKGIHPLLGCQLSVVEDEEPNNAYPLVVYVQNQEGYQNLCQLISLSTKPPRKGCIEFSLFFHHSAGLLVLSGGGKGILSQYIRKNQEDKALKHLLLWKEKIGNNLYIELSRYDNKDQHQVEENILVQWAYDHGLPLLATNEAFFLKPSSFEAHDILQCVAQGRYVIEDHRPRLTENHYFRSPREMERVFRDLPEALLMTQHVRQRCTFLLEPRVPTLPSFPGIESEEDFMRKECQRGLEKRLQEEVFPRLSPEQHEATHTFYEKRLAYELDVILSMKFAGYFLIVSDFIRWAKNHDIPVGPGRGSGASSLVAWTLNITDVDPIRFSLLFERFLNPERVSMPDFDVDFCQERREEVIAYVKEKYGAQRVAHIITFGSLQARGVLRDVGRVLQLPYSQVDKICKMIPHNPAHPISLAEAIAKEPHIRALAKENDTIQKLLDIGCQLEGLYRHASTHAAGLIIGDQPLTQILPLYYEEGSSLPATEFSMKYVESMGLIKFDFLGLKTLTVLKQAVALVQKKGIDLDLLKIPLDDPKTFLLLCAVETVGLFQIESAGMSEVLRQLMPEKFEEIIALVALYRPGPMDDIPRYIACRHGRESITYPYACLENILKETFGVMVYQEQVLQIAQVLAGYSLGSADLLRRAMGKKIPAEMEAQRHIFVEGTLKHSGGTRETALALFEQIAKFAGYAFPKAHAAPYALISYQTAYMKANYPTEFMVALLNNETQNTDKIHHFLREAQRMKISIFPPDVNASLPLFSEENSEDMGPGIRYGLVALRHVGATVMERICQERKNSGPFRDIFHFIERVGGDILNKKSIESLIAAGAFDTLHPRDLLLGSLEKLVQYAHFYVPHENLLFSPEDTRPKLMASSVPCDVLLEEYKALGFYLSAHPLDAYFTDKKFSSVVWADTYASFASQEPFWMVGVIGSVEERLSKKGKKFVIVRVSDPTGSYDISVFQEALGAFRPLLEVGQRIALFVQKRKDGDILRLSLENMCLLEGWTPPSPVSSSPDVQDFSQSSKKFLSIRIQEEKELIELKEILLENAEEGMECFICIEDFFTVKLPGRYTLPASERFTFHRW